MSSEIELRNSLQSIGLAPEPANLRVLERLQAAAPTEGQTFDHLLRHLLSAIRSTGSAGRVLVGFQRLILDHPAPQSLIRILAEHPRNVEILARLFASSQFLTEILLRHPDYLERLEDYRALAYVYTQNQFQAAAVEAIQARFTPDAMLDALRQYQRWELLRTGVCDLLGLFDLPTITSQLAYLAGAIAQVCLEIASQQTQIALDGFFVLGMGKLGGGELNYSSDIDLLFLTTGDPAQHVRLAERLIHALVNVTSEGFLYRVDMRLRPWGSVGALVSSVEGYWTYLERHARLWERQALLKARPVAGNLEAGEKFLHGLVPYLFGSGTSPSALRKSVLDMKQRTEARLRQRGQANGEVKLGEGSIRDVEFIVQYLQLRHGGQHPEIRSRGTLQALHSLAALNLIRPGEYETLASGYTFLRAIEHHLQLMDYRQTHILPEDPAALADLGQRLGFQGAPASGEQSGREQTSHEQAGKEFMLRYQQHSTAIRTIYLNYIGSETMDDGAETTKAQPTGESSTEPPLVRKHLARLDPSYETTFSPEEIHQHARMADQLDSERLVELDAHQLEDGRWRVTIVAYDYLGELSLICGLMFVYGLNIQGGEVFTYEPATPPADGTATPTRSSYLGRSEGMAPRGRPYLPRPTEDNRRKIVDVFTVDAHGEAPSAEFWESYRLDLLHLLQRMQVGERREARGDLANRVAARMQDLDSGAIRLHRVNVEVDNQTSELYTLLHIDALDTPGFLYELTNALAYSRTNIVRVSIESIGDRVKDTLYVTDDRGQKMIDEERQRELRATIVLIKQFTHLLPHSPNPGKALLHFREFVAQLMQRPNWPDELTSLERTEVLDGIVRLLGVSNFLWEDFLRIQYANLFPVVRDVDALAVAHRREDLQQALECLLAEAHPQPHVPDPAAPWVIALNAFKDREMFRIDMRQILGHTVEFSNFSEELTDLADIVINSAFHLAGEDLRSVYGTPRMANGQEAKATVCALGKCGGRELGFASDIELMILYGGNGKTDGPQSLSVAEYYEKLVEYFVRTIHSRREGVFEIDLQLRPYGKAGSLAVSLESFRNYFSPEGPAWAYERQALLRLRHIAGDEPMGEQVEALRDAYVYRPGAFDVTAMRAMRERQLHHLVAAGAFHPKYSPGGLVDVEYLVQGLQMIHGAEHPELRTPNTRQAMQALHRAGLLNDEEYTHLHKAHTFLRWLIESLRIVHGNAKDLTIPPKDSDEFTFLAQRMRYGKDTRLLEQEMRQYTGWVQEINRRKLA